MALDEEKKQKCLVAGSVSAVLVIMVVSVAVLTSKNSPNENQIRQTTKAVKAICAPTDYKEICLNRIMDASPNSTEPLELIKLAINVTIESINQGLKKASIDVKPKTGEDPEAKDAFELCEKLMSDAIDDLKKCVNRGFSATKIVGFVEDLRVWLSGSIAFQETCIDSFKEIKSNTLMLDMRKIFKPSKRLTSNSLAMVTELSTILPNSNTTGLTKALSNYARKLLNTKDGIPTWVRPEVRKLMEEEAPLIVLEPQPPPPPPPSKTDAVVAQDGSGQFKTIAEALNFVPKDNSPFIIYIKTGIYKEQVKITKKMPYVTLIGDGQNLTVITGSLNFGIGRVKTYLTATVTIEGEHFTAKAIGIENTAGPDGRQAVALRVSADYAVFYECKFDGYQDTLFVHSQRQFYRDCTVTGTIDFVFGDAKCILQNSVIVFRKPKRGQTCVVAAQGRSDRHESTGLVFQNCHVTGDEEYMAMKPAKKSFLGRPWKRFSRTIVLMSALDDVVDPDGWLRWKGDFALKTLYFAEYMSAGFGANDSVRVKWPGVKNITDEEAQVYTGGRFLGGDTWIPQTQVPYIANL
ncbi:Pectinesterase inhibitor domain-containing protein [Hirschfeldia incana]|nr:Pectinesterase inhibitor domain-containing protein [Hirschfeldia incana]